MADFKSIGDMMQSYADRAVQTAHDRFGFELDYTESSIESLETILASVSTSLNLLENEQVEEQVKLWGGYLGRLRLGLDERRWRICRCCWRVLCCALTHRIDPPLKFSVSVYRRPRIVLVVLAAFLAVLGLARP